MDGRRSVASLKPFFTPESVAIIGASRVPGKGGYNVIENLLRLSYPGRVYPVNPRAENILGLPVNPALKDIPSPPELAVIVLPPQSVLAAVEECIAAGVKAVIIESAGFGEMDEAGVALETRLSRRGGGAGTRVLGGESAGRRY